MFTNDRSHDGNLSLDIGDYCYFFSSGNIEPFWTYQNFSFREDGRMYMYTPPLSPFMDEGLSEERVKKDN